MVSGYSELTVSQYDRIVDILNGHLSDVDKDLHIVSVLCGLDVHVLKALEVGVVNDMIGTAKFLSVPYHPIEVSEFDWGGYHFVIDHNISYGQYCDVLHAKGSGGLLHAILIPEGHSYNDGYDIDFGDMSYELGMGIILGFVNGLRVYAGASLKSLRPRLVERIFSKRYRQVDSLVRDMANWLSSGK